MVTPTTSRQENILLTGGLGFIGTHLACAYLNAGHRVTLLDAMISAVSNGQEYASNPNAKIIKSSVEDFFLSEAGIEEYTKIIHAASYVGPAGILEHTGQLGSNIVRPAQQVIDACVRHNKPLILFSSAEVYGRTGILRETDTIQVPSIFNTRIEYAIAKLLTECIASNCTKRGLKAIVIRPFNVAGPRQSRAGGFVIPTFVQQALSNQPITVFAGGEQTRAFLAANDLSRFLVEFSDAALASPQIIFNIGNPENTVSISTLASLIKNLCESHSEIKFVDAKSIHGDLYEEALSIDKIPALDGATSLGWQPQVDLTALLMGTIDYYKNNHDPRDG